VSAIYFGLGMWGLKIKREKKNNTLCCFDSSLEFLNSSLYPIKDSESTNCWSRVLRWGRLDIIAKVLQGIVIGLSCIAIHHMKKTIEYSHRK
jgi:hypothetical protein